jgi:dihydroorotate dehydrogenase
VTVNISSPNTRTCATAEKPRSTRCSAPSACAAANWRPARRTVPIFLKIAPDLDADQVEAIAATQEARDRRRIAATRRWPASPRPPPHGDEAGASGAPLLAASSRVDRGFVRLSGRPFRSSAWAV